MKIVVDKFIPFVKGVLERYGDVSYLSPEEITKDEVRDADALLIRTRTAANRGLLEGSKCSFVATATIGKDHIDEKWCSESGISTHNAPGCNAPAVAQYVFSALAHLYKGDIADKKIAVVGVGNIGGIVARWAENMGMKVMRVDPPRQKTEGGRTWNTLAEAANEADIITFHTPLTKEGNFATYHLADESFFNSLKRKPIIINASRGGVVDNRAWLDAIEKGLTSASVVDVWEGEPLVNTELLRRADIVTPHIAGYSVDGKIRATQMVLDAFSAHFGLPEIKADAPAPSLVPDVVKIEHVAESYDIMGDDAMMRTRILECKNDDERKIVFEKLRDEYVLRKECDNSQFIIHSS